MESCGGEESFLLRHETSRQDPKIIATPSLSFCQVKKQTYHVCVCLFENAHGFSIYMLFRYSIWLDSKLRLQLDPLLILEYFLWRKGYEYAISNHYDRHCLWEEVAQNKRLNKYNHSVIDEQFAFYQADGMRRFNSSDPNRLLPSSTVSSTHLYFLWFHCNL